MNKSVTGLDQSKNNILYFLSVEKSELAFLVCIWPLICPIRDMKEKVILQWSMLIMVLLCNKIVNWDLDQYL